MFEGFPINTGPCDYGEEMAKEVERQEKHDIEVFNEGYNACKDAVLKILKTYSVKKPLAVLIEEIENLKRGENK